MTDSIRILQANLQHCVGATAIILNRFCNENIDIVLVQEPWVNKGVKGLNHKSGKTICDHSIDNPRAAILLSNSIKFTPMNHFISKDLVAILIHTPGEKEETVIASAYFPGDDTEEPPPAMIQKLISFCQKQHLQFVIGCDANAHHSSWGSTDNNKRGESLFNYLSSNDICVLNEGREPTYSFNGREEVLDISFCSPETFPLIKNWHVSKEISLSDHRHIIFDVSLASNPTAQKRNPRKTDWDLFSNIIRVEMDNLPTRFVDSYETEEGANRLNDSLQFAYNHSTKLTRYTRDQPIWWSDELSKLRSKSRSLYNRARKTGNFENYSRQLTVYNSALRRARRNSWKDYSSNQTDVYSASRIFKALNKSKSNGLGFIKTPSGDYTNSRDETLKLMLATHFPESIPFANSSNFVPFSNRLITHGNSFKIASKVITKDKVAWAVNSFKPFKAPGGDGVIPIMIQKSIPYILETLTNLFRTSLATGFVPSLWCLVNVIFIPKPGKDIELPKSYRPISLSSFLLKTMERLIDVHIRETIALSSPLHKLQFAYMKGKSTELAAHHLVSKLEHSLTNRNIALCAFMDIQGAFDNTSFRSIDRALTAKGIDSTTTIWIRSMLESRKISSPFSCNKLAVSAAKGCPQGGVLSPLLWSIVIDELLNDLNRRGFHIIGYADDVVITIEGICPNTISELMGRALDSTQKWCSLHGLSVNPTKTVLMPFYKGKARIFPQICMKNTPLAFSCEATYLGLKLDRTLSWKPHLQHITSKANKTFWALRCLVGNTWGLSPKITLQLYKTMIRPIVSYCSLVWWPAVTSSSGINLCNKIQSTPCRIAAGAIKSCPTIPLEAILNIDPLHIYIQAMAAKSAIRLQSTGNRILDRSPIHGKIVSFIPQWELFASQTDLTIPILNFQKSYSTIIPDRSSYENSSPFLNDSSQKWYTDGSKTCDGSGAGIFGPNRSISITLDEYASVFQSEVVAISVCAATIASCNPKGQVINIFSDSQAAIKAISNVVCCSCTVLECKENLNKLGSRNRVKIVWIPGHSGYQGNEEADRLARKGSTSISYGPHPSIRVGWFSVLDQISKWTLSLKHSYWKSRSDLKQSKQMINLTLHKKISLTNRKDLKLFIGFLTGQHPTNSYLYRIGRSPNPTCRLCDEEDETTAHLMLSCRKICYHRRNIFGKPLLDHRDIFYSETQEIIKLLRLVDAALGT